MTEGREEPADDLRAVAARMARGSVWMVALRWIIRGIGLLSTIILARLLAPNDFGIIAMAMIIVGLLETFAEAGVDLALIRNPAATRRHFDAAWTFRVIQGFVLAIIIVLSAPIAASYFSEPQLIVVIRVLALRALIEGFENIGVVVFRKELEFAKEFRFQVYRKLLIFVITVTAALVLANHWALVIGMVGGPLLGVALSYAMHPYRPRLSLEGFAEIWSFSRWVLANNLGDFLFRQIDQVVIGRVAGTVAMGTYGMAMDLATMPTRAAVMPIESALFPGYAKLAARPNLVAQIYLTVLGIVSLVASVIGLGIAALAHDLVLVVLGSKWAGAVPVMEWLGIFGAANGFTYSAHAVLTVLGRVNVVAYRTWWQLAVLAPAVLIAGTVGGIAEIAMARTIVGLLFVLVTFHLLASTRIVSYGEILAAIWRPLAAGLAMFALLRSIDLGAVHSPAVRLAIEVPLGAVVFVGAQLMFWVVAGRPRGPEDTVIGFLRRRVRAPQKP